MNLRDDAYAKIRDQLLWGDLVEKTGGQGGGIRLTQKGKDEVSPAEDPGGATGSGFFVSSEHVLTNAHVVHGYNQIRITKMGRKPVEAHVLALDEINDLALLRVAQYPKNQPFLQRWLKRKPADELPSFRTIEARVGEKIAVYGFPYLNEQSGRFTEGIVTAASGLGGNTSRFQISASVNPGTSGGPVLDQEGNVVGIVVAGLDPMIFFDATGGHLPEGSNFAVKADVALSFLRSNRVTPATSSHKPGMNTWSFPVGLAESITVFIECDMQ